MRAKSTLLTAAAAALMLCLGSASAQDLEQTKVTVGLPVTTSTFLPLYLAEEEGYFKEEGLEVELVAFRGGTDLVRGMVAGAVDVAVGAMAELMVGIRSGQEIRAFYGGFNMAVFEWYAVPEITSIEQTKGKRFGVTRFGSSTDYLTRYVLNRNGLNPETDVQIIQGGGSGARMAAMEAGQLDVNIYAPPETFMSADQGYSKIYDQQDIAKDYPNHTFYAPLDFLESKPNTIKALLRAFVKGVRLAKADRERSIKTISQRIGVDEAYAGRTYDDFIDEVYEDGRFPSEAGMKAFWEIGIENGEYDRAWSEEEYLVRTFMDSYDEWKPE
jgi:NitT/TauT family transport system substrate-binding protein